METNRSKTCSRRLLSEDKTICLSIVSHGQGEMVIALLNSIEKYCTDLSLVTVVTLNIKEYFPEHRIMFSRPLITIKNSRPQGFGTNHNAVFTKFCTTNYFCVLNPDILFPVDPFPHLLSLLEDETIGVVGPALVDSRQRLQDSARRCPTPGRILARRLIKKKIPEFKAEKGIIYPDWIAGMFMLFPAKIFDAINGFDERFYMYCEDADICMRLKKRNLVTAYASDVKVIHDPRRSSHRSLRHLFWHISSLLRFFSLH